MTLRMDNNTMPEPEKNPEFDAAKAEVFAEQFVIGDQPWLPLFDGLHWPSYRSF